MILHLQLQQDCFTIGRFPLCALLLLNDSNYPWFILVPQRDNINEIHQLSDQDQQQLMRESSMLAACLEQTFNADKMNIAALGNIVPQLHIHHIVRYRSDPVWPAPVWGKIAAMPYSDDAAKKRCEQIRTLLNRELLSQDQ